MTELEWFGRTFRSPVPLPPGYWLAPLVALLILVGSILGLGERVRVPPTKHPIIETIQPEKIDQSDV